MENGFIIILELVSGVGIFLYGMALMATSLQKTAGSKMKGIIEAFTKNRIFGVGVGTLVTMIIQSSTATTIMVVGFVNAGIMTLIQATSVIMGANIGTTVTAQLVAFNFDTIAPIIAGASAVIWIITSNKTLKNVMQVFIGFGILFMGITILKDAMYWLSDSPVFTAFIAQFSGTTASSYMILLLTGILVTVVVQSSSTITTIMVTMATQGLLTLPMAIPLILGSNVGTTVTTIFSSLGASRNAKRAACIHVLFNILGVILFVIVLNKPVTFFVELIGGDLARQIANVHTLFNVSTTLIMLPFIKLLVKAVERFIPIRENEVDKFATSLDARILESPAVAIERVYDEMDKMGQLVRQNYDFSVKCLIDFEAQKFQFIKDMEESINFKQREIKDYLQKLMQKDISAKQHKEINAMFSIANDIERVGDHAENIAELAEYRYAHKISFSETAFEEIQNLNQYVLLSCDQTIESVKKFDVNLAHAVVAREEMINELEKDYREGHMTRLNEGSCTPESGVVFLDAISNMERVADRLKKVSHVILDYGKAEQ